MFQRSTNNKGVVEVLISHCVTALGKRLATRAATYLHHSLYSVCIVLTDDLHILFSISRVVSSLGHGTFAMF